MRPEFTLSSDKDYDRMPNCPPQRVLGATFPLRLEARVHWLAAASVLIVVSFYAPFLWMLNQWFVVEEYSPGPAVPVLCMIALWHALKTGHALPKVRKRALRMCVGAAALLAGIVYLGKEHSPLVPGAEFLTTGSFSVLFGMMTLVLLYSGFLLQRAESERAAGAAEAPGLALLLLSLAMHLISLRGDFPRASIVAYVSLLFSICWYLNGWKNAKRLAFPYALLILMVPLEFIDEIAGVPLRILATDGAVFLMRLTGLQVEQTGNWFAIGSMEFTVDAPCSGLKSLIALTALGATFAYVTQRTFLKKVLLAACAIPIAIVTNVVRLACVGISAHFFGRDVAVKVFHDHATLVLYILAILILISLDRRVFQSKWFKIKNF